MLKKISLSQEAREKLAFSKSTKEKARKEF